MAQFKETLFDLRGRVRTARPNVPVNLVDSYLNERLRELLDLSTFWADLLRPGIISFPDPFSTGTVSMATGSAVVAGVGTAWPVSDVVNTVIPDGVPEFGYAEVYPASMAGIGYNSMLYVDAAGDPEVVPVVEVRRTSVVAQFAKVHNPNCTITQSSLANQQLRINQAYPIFTVQAVIDPTTLQLSLPWGGPPITAQTYQIKLMYITTPPDMKTILAAKDEQSGYPIRLHLSLDEANYRDPKRMLVSGNPWYGLVDLGANDQGNMMYEAWPAPSSARQWSYWYQRQWPDMVKDTDRPPHFINPSILVYGAVADAKMYRADKDDSYYDPQGAQFYLKKYADGILAAKNANEAKKLEAMKNPWWRSMMPGNYDMMQLTDPGTYDFWSGGTL